MEAKVKNFELEEKNYQLEYNNLLRVINEYNQNINHKISGNNFQRSHISKSPEKTNSLKKSNEFDEVNDLKNSRDDINSLKESKHEISGIFKPTNTLSKFKENFEKKFLRILQDSEETYKILEEHKYENIRLLKKEQFLAEQLENMKKSDNEKIGKIDTQREIIRAIKLIISSSMSSSKVYIDKFINSVNSLENNNYTQNFAESLLKFSNRTNHILSSGSGSIDGNLPDIIKALDEFTKLICYELEVN